MASFLPLLNFQERSINYSSKIGGMKLNFRHFTTIILSVLILICAYKKESVAEVQECDIKTYIPESYLDWLPYHSINGDTLPNKYFQIEDKYYFMSSTDLQFYNESLDSQTWRLTYVIDQFRQQTYHGCPLYQEIKYTLYNGEIGTHLNLGFIHRDTNYTPSKENTELYIPMINVGACKTTFEDSEGILGGTCYSTAFDINNLPRYSKIEFFEEFDTPFGSYKEVFLIQINHSPVANLSYDIYLAKNRGIIAFENQGNMWSLK